MYRSYEDPGLLEAQLAELKEAYARETDEDRLIDLAIEIEDLKQRINFAWQDDEYDGY